MPSNASARAWAVKDATGLLVRTVSDSPRAAMVSWLVAYASIPVAHWWGEQDIHATFADRAPKRGAEVVEVRIAEATANDR